MTAKNDNQKPATSSSPAYDATGMFVWYELRTHQPKQSLVFFSEVLGWKTSVMAMGGSEYTMLLAGETPVGGVVPQTAGPAAFISYLHVPDVDAAAQRVAQAGGSVLGAPFDVPTVGRMVEVKDQEGATFFLFKFSDAPTPGPRTPGAFHWNELWANDEKRAVAFLTSVVGYSVEAMPMPGMTYHVLSAKAGPAAGVMKSPAPGLAPAWLPYIHVDNTDAAVSRARTMGGTLEDDINDIPNVGRVAMLRAPDGARFAVITPSTEK